MIWQNMVDAERFAEYTKTPDSAWNLVEGKVLNYVLERYYKDRFDWLKRKENELIPATITKYDSLIPKDFRVLDIGTGTGNVAHTLVEFGVDPRNIVGLDNDPNMLKTSNHPDGVNKLHAGVQNFVPKLKEEFPGFGNFDMVTANMVFHLLNYGDYVKSLKQIKQVMAERSQLYIMLPHPLREDIHTIAAYHDRRTLDEITPWCEPVEYKVKTINEYKRGLAQAGLNTWKIRTTGADQGLEDNFLLSDEAVWSHIRADTNHLTKAKPPHYFRLWLMASR